MARFGGPVYRRRGEWTRYWKKRRRRLASVAAVAGTLTVPFISSTAQVFPPTLVYAQTVTAPAIASTATLYAPTVSHSFDFPYPAGVSTTNRLVDQNGQVFLLKAMSSWGMAQRLSNAEITSALEDLAALGFNCVNFAFCGGVDSQSDWDAVQYKNKAGSNFFSGTPFQTGLGTAFATTDWIVQECARLEMIAMMALFISYGDTGIRADIDAATNAQMRTFGQAVGARYNAYPNVVWEIEADDGWQADNTTARRIDYFARGLDEGRTSYTNLWFAEPYLSAPDCRGMFLDQEGSDPTGYQWLHLCANGKYWYGTDVVPAIEDVWGNTTAYTSRDVCLWDSEPSYAQAGRGADPIAFIRQQNYSDFFEGATGTNFGHEEWWPFDLSGLFTGTPPDWEDVPASTELIEAGYCWGLIDAYCKDLTWAPLDSFVTTGEGTGASKAAVGAGAAAILAYFPDNRTIQVNTTLFPGTSNVRVRWFDPVLNSYSTISSSVAQQTGYSVTLPAARGDGSRDFVLIVDQPQALVMPTIASTATLYAPTVTPGPRTLTLPAIAATTTLYAPTLVPGSLTVSPPAIASTAAVFAPTVSAGTVTLSPPAIAATTVLYAPSVTPGTVTLGMPTIASTAALFAPTVTPGAVTVSPPAIASGAVLFAPTLTQAGTISPPAIGPTATLFAPTLTPGGVTVTAPFIASGVVLFPPTVTPGAVTLTLPAITSTVALFAPTLVPSGGLSLPAIASTATLYAPTLTPGAVTVRPPLLGPTAVLYPPAVFDASIPPGPNPGSAASRVFGPSAESRLVDPGDSSQVI